jgi:hypothetical protein
VTVARRLAAVEADLDPTQLVNRWLAEAHAYDSFEGFLDATILAGPSEPPLDRLIREVSQATRSRRPAPPDVEMAVRTAIRSTVFRFFLALRIIEATESVLERETLVHGYLSAHALLALESERWRAMSDLGPAGLRDVIVGRVGELTALRDARVEVESRYLSGQSPLFAATVRGWDELFQQAEALARQSVRIAEFMDAPTMDADVPLVPDGRRERCVLDLTEPARAKTLDLMGDGRGALDRFRRWLG